MFHKVEEIVTENVQYDFSGAGLGPCKTQLVQIDGMVVFNNLLCLDFRLQYFQALLCTCCGIQNCSPGSWTAFRQLNERVYLVPVIELMQEEQFNYHEYFPPAYLMRKGSLVFTKEKYEELRQQTGRFPKLEALAVLTSRDLLACHQITAPGNFLGKLGGMPRIDPELVLAVSEGNLEQQVEDLQACVSSAFEANHALDRSNFFKRAEFHLDLPGFPTWSGMAYSDNNKPVLVS